nr:MAG: RNA-dependent RNA polymerase [Grapevine leafroll-associated virus 7]
MNLVFPTQSAYDFIHRTLSFEQTDFDIPVLGNAKVSMSNSKVYVGKTYKLPLLCGKGERARPNTWKQVLISLSHRNFAAPQINEEHDQEFTSSVLFESLMSCMKLEKISECFDVVEPCLNKIDMWLTTRDSRRFKGILNNLSYDVWVEQVTNLKLMVKGDIKPKLDESHYDKYAPPSNIVYYQQMINMFFSPVFLEIMGRIKYCLKDNIVLYGGMNLSELGSVIKSKLTDPLPSYNYTELDFSKFDKSQGTIIKMYEETVYKFFKFSPNTYDNFKLSEYFCQASSNCGVKVDLFSSRRTGSPNTWLSNTLCTLAILSATYQLEDYDLILVSGDDSLLVSKNPVLNKAYEINKNFGMECKFMEHPCPYFCSKFLVEVDDNCIIMPDLVKVFERWSNPIPTDMMENDGVLKERFTSYKDLLQGYFNDNISFHLDLLLSKRYFHPEGASYAAFCFIHVVLSNFRNFKEIFDTSSEVII